MINQVNWKHFLYPSTKFFSDLRLSKLPVVMFRSLHMKESCACGAQCKNHTLKNDLLEHPCKEWIYNTVVQCHIHFKEEYINPLPEKKSNSLAKQVGSTHKVLPGISRSCFLPSVDWREKCGGTARGDVAVSLWHGTSTVHTLCMVDTVPLLSNKHV